MLTSLGLSMQQVLHLGPAPGKGDSPLLGLLPRHSLALFSQCASWGSPLLGVGGAGDPHVEAGSATTAGGGYLAQHGGGGGHHPGGDGWDWHGGAYQQEACGPRALQAHAGGGIELPGQSRAHQQQPRQRLEQAHGPGQQQEQQQQWQQRSLEEARYEQQMLLQQQQQMLVQQQQQLLLQQGRGQRQYTTHHADDYLAGDPYVLEGRQQQQQQHLQPEMGWPGQQERQQAMQYPGRGAAAAGAQRQAGFGQAGGGGVLAGVDFSMDPSALFSAQLLGAPVDPRQGRGGEPTRRLPDEVSTEPLPNQSKGGDGCGVGSH